MIKADAFPEGHLPSEPKLASQMGVSRTTIRQAFASLEQDGILLRRQEAGTYVNQRVMNIGSRLEEVWNFTEKLALSAGEEVLATTNVFTADDIPAIYCLDVIPAGLVRSAYRDEELHGPVYDFLEKRCGQRVDHNISEVCPVVASHSISRILGCRPGSPLHYFEEVAFNAEEMPVMYSEEYYRPEYFSFNVIRKMTAHSMQ